jgi:hypothetical protein
MKAMYVPPHGDSDVVTMFGIKFFAGQEKDVSALGSHAIKKLRGNPHFVVTEGEKKETAKK